jgi:hypothetical protein
LSGRTDSGTNTNSCTTLQQTSNIAITTGQAFAPDGGDSTYLQTDLVAATSEPRGYILALAMLWLKRQALQNFSRHGRYGEQWFKIRNPKYSQYEGRHETFEKKRGASVGG